MASIKGLDKLSRDLKDAQRALSALDGDLAEVSFNPEDPASIEAAVRHVNDTIDQRVGRYLQNPIIGPLVEGMKERYRSAIMDRAAEARLRGEKSDGE